MRFRVSILILALVLIPAFSWLFWQISQPETISESLESFGKLGDEVRASVTALPTIAPAKASDGYSIEDGGQNAIKISYANEDESQKLNSSSAEKLSLSFPKDPSKGNLEVRLPSDKMFSFKSLEFTSYTSSVVTGDEPVSNLEAGLPSGGKSLLERIFPKKEAKYLRYESEDGRKLLYYSYQSDGTTGEKTLKHWTIYRRGEGNEKETYSFDHALLKKNDDGSVNVYYTDPDALKNQEGAAGVDTNLLERAQRVLAQDQTESGEPDAIIPAPYVLDKDGERHDLTWEVSDDRKLLTTTYSLSPDLYPLALDPTLSFTAPAQSNTGDTITGETAGDSFGANIVVGDWNNDGKIDLAVSAGGYSAGTGRIYLFYNDGKIESLVKGADYIITGTGGSFGAYTLGAGDLNADGRTDLIVTAGITYSTPGFVYIFYNDGSIPTTAAAADVTITGENNYDGFGHSVGIGDFNADGRKDLVVGARSYNPGGAVDTGRAYILYNDGSYPSAAGSADVIISSEGISNSFGYAVVSGDFNADGKVDVVVGASGYGANNGRAYVFYADGTNNYGTAACTGSAPTTCLAANADAIMTGSGDYFGYAFNAGDLNADGKTDLAVGAYGYNTNYGRAYIFYNGSITTEAATGADVIITGESGSQMGFALGSGDLNADGRVDLIAGSVYGGTGRAYLFYNDGSIPTTGATADVIFTGHSNSFFSASFASGDFNADGKIDLAVGAFYYNNNYNGRVYLYYADGTNNFGTATCSGTPAICAAADADVIIDGQGGIPGNFGYSLAAGDLNADGRTDLAVGAQGPGVYIFYNDGSYPTSYAQADVAIAGVGAGDNLGTTIITGDFNADGRTDLIAEAFGAPSYSNSGRVYMFYNDGSYPTSAASADVMFEGEYASYYGTALAAGDFNTDGKTDLAVGAHQYGTNTGRVYIIMSEAAVESVPASALKTRGNFKVRGNFRVR